MKRIAALELLDLYDRGGRISHKKLLPLILFFAAILFQAIGKQFDSTVLLILGAIAFGPRMYGLIVDARRPQTPSYGFTQVGGAAAGAATETADNV